ncbi:Folate receptor alpha [Thelohanellus kitauei]|uniref:Folate receptor alpha n=1 Tax=Thelohanellus kitauei TaxID=669202 RepID=A0A0C2MMB1_THEKT|nr:Folate receptor alpha [Thelohanellus kitauei]
MAQLVMCYVIALFLPVTFLTKQGLYCIKTTEHKSLPGSENAEEMGICKPWSHESCCDTKTAQKITTLDRFYIPGVPLNQCPDHTLSAKCKQYFQYDLCLYQCGSMFLPWVQSVINGKTRKERLRGIPLCSNDCDSWFEACRDDYTCSSTWYPNSFTTQEGQPVCVDQCKTFKDYHQNSKQFCETIFKGSFKYSRTGDKCCMKLSPESAEENMKCARLYSDTTRLIRFNEIFFILIVAGCLLLLIVMFVHRGRLRRVYGLWV